jgi:hypothetical protein
VHRFMQRLNTAYGMYFRFKHGRPGHCFQGGRAGTPPASERNAKSKRRRPCKP